MSVYSKAALPADYVPLAARRQQEEEERKRAEAEKVRSFFVCVYVCSVLSCLPRFIEVVSCDYILSNIDLCSFLCLCRKRSKPSKHVVSPESGLVYVKLEPERKQQQQRHQQQLLAAQIGKQHGALVNHVC